MLHAADPRLQYCNRVHSDVRVCRPEAACRLEHGCTKPNCPLEAAFGAKAFDERMKAFATVFDLWPLTDGKTPDFP